MGGVTPWTAGGRSMNIPEKYQKLVSILIFAGSLLISIAVLFIRVDPAQVATLGYGGIFLITFLGGLTIFIPGPTFLAAFIIGSVLNPFLVAVLAGFGSALGETTGYGAGYASRALSLPSWRATGGMPGFSGG